MKASVATLKNGKRIALVGVMVLVTLVVLVGVPEAGVDGYHGVSSDGATDILLPNSSNSVDRVTQSFHPGRVLSEVRQSVLVDSVRRVLARYRRMLDPEEQEELARALLDEGRRHDIDPLFLAALIRVESAFSKDAISNKGARGLMQVMPATGEEMALRLGLEWAGPNGLHNPDYNLRVGAYYLRQLLDHYQGDYRRALTAYNRGPRRLRHIMQRYGRLQQQFTDYFRKIQQIYRDYKRWLGPSATLLDLG